MSQKTKTAEILCVGTELLMGNTVNTNATAIARGLAEVGLNLYHQGVVGDNPQRLAEALGASSVTFPGSMEMTLHADGSSEFALELTVDEAPLALTMTMSGTSTATDSALQCRVQVKNVCDVTFQAAAAVQAGQTAPFSAPPADAVIVDMGAAPLVMSPAA